MSRSDTMATEADAGGKVTVIFHVTNRDAVARRLEGTAILPRDWQHVSGGGGMDVSPGENRAIFIQARVPARTAPGMHELRLEVRVAGAPRIREVLAVRVRVRERRALEVLALDAPRFALAGSDYSARFVVRNRGNIVARLRLVASEHAGFTIDAPAKDVTLEAGAAREVDIVVHTRTGRPGVLRHVLQLDAVAADRLDTDTTQVASASTSVLVLPGPGDRAPRFHELPVLARVGVTPSTGAFGSRTIITGELTGGGQIADGSSTRVDFRVRESQGSAFGRQSGNEYALTIANPHLKLLLGDHVHSLSPLTEPGREAAGVSIHGEARGFSFRAMAARNRRFDDGTTTLGTSLGYGVANIGRVTANVLERTGPDSSRVASVRAQLAPSPLATLDVETAAGLDSSAGRPAISATLSGWHPRVTYSLQHVDIPSGFSGPWRGLRTDAASVALRVTGRTRLHASGHQQRTAVSRTALLRSGVGGIRSGEVGIGFDGKVNIAMLRAVALGDSTDRGFGAHESLVRVQAGSRLGAANVLATMLAGDVWAGDTSERARTYDVSVQAGLRVARSGSLTASVQHVRGPRLHSLTGQEVTTASLRARIAPVKRVTLDVAVAGSRRATPQRHDFLSLEGALTYQAPRGHAISMSVRGQGRDAASAFDGTTVHVGYAIPLGIPVGYARSGNRLEGRIYDSETGKGVPNAMVLVGESMAVTDAHGRLSMSGLGSGAQMLQLDLGAAGANRVVLDPKPLELTMRPGRAERVDVALVRGGTISGQVRRLAPASMATWDGTRAALSDGDGQTGVVVTVDGNGESHRRLTDSDGRFTMEGLRPGRWTVSIDPADAPEHHYIEMPRTSVDLTPGQVATASFAVLPRKRTLVMIDAAEVVADGARATATRPPTRQPAPMSTPSAVSTTTAASVRTAPADRAPTPTRVLPRPARPTPPAQPAARPNAAVAAAAPRALPPTRRPGFHVVSATDRTLENVAIWIYGDAALWPKLWLANKATLASPDALKPGMFLIVPPRAPLTPAEIRAREALRRPDGARR